MKDGTQITISICSKQVRAFLAESDLWLSQASLAMIYDTTPQNVTIHLKKLSRHLNSAKKGRRFLTVQREGQRAVSRLVCCYSIEAAHAIGVRAQKFDELNALMAIAEEYGVLKRLYQVVPIRELDFAQTLTAILGGVCTVVRQFHVLDYYVDFYIPEYSIAIEYDESHHQRPAQSRADHARQQVIEGQLGVKFIRVVEGGELVGLNMIVRHIVFSKARRA